MEELGFGCRCGQRHHSGDFTLSNAVAHYAPDLTLEPVHLDISLNLDIEASHCEAIVTTTVLARAEGADQLTLHGVDFVDVQVRSPQVRHQYNGEEIKLCWDNPFKVGERRDVTVSYRLDHPSTGLHFSFPTDAYPNTPLFAGTDNESERARHWLACVDLPSVRPTLSYHLTSREDFTFLANGVLTGEETKDGTKNQSSNWICRSRN